MHIVKDSYTGFYWCGKALHLLTPENRTERGKCKSCLAHQGRQRRSSKKPTVVRRARRTA